MKNFFLILSSFTIVFYSLGQNLAYKNPGIQSEEATVLKQEENRQAEGKGKIFPKFRLGITGGLGNTLGKLSDSIPEEFHNYVNRLRKGLCLGAEINFFPSETIGFGFKYSIFNPHSEYPEPIYILDPKTGYPKKGKLKNDMIIQSFAPVLNFKYSSANGFYHLITGISVGYLTYQDNAILVDSYVLKGQTMLVGLNVDMDVWVDPNLALGVGVGLTMGSLDKFEETKGNATRTIKLEDGKRETVTRVDLTVGLKFYK